MYCPQCKIEIQDPLQEHCPLCSTPLIGSCEPASPSHDDSPDTFKLKELIRDVKKNLEELPGDANITFDSNADRLLEEQFKLDDSDENAFILNLGKSEGEGTDATTENPFGHEYIEADLDTFDLEKELNLSVTEKKKQDSELSDLITTQSDSGITQDLEPALHQNQVNETEQGFPASSAQPVKPPAHEETKEAALERTLDELDKVHAAQQKPPGRPILHRALFAALVVCCIGAGIFYITAQQDEPVVVTRPKASPEKIIVKDVPLPLQKKGKNEAALPMPMVDNTTMSDPKNAVTAQNIDSIKALPPVAAQAERPAEPQTDAPKKEEKPVEPIAGKEPIISPSVVQGKVETAGESSSVPAQQQQNLEIKISPTSASDKGTPPRTPEEGGIAPSQPYTIHTDSYKKEVSALRETTRLKKSGFDAYAQTINLNERGVWHRVMIGKFTTLEEAQKVQKALQTKYKKADARILRVEP